MTWGKQAPDVSDPRFFPVVTSGLACQIPVSAQNGRTTTITTMTMSAIVGVSFIIR